jgi:hypothetical protein
MGTETVVALGKGRKYVLLLEIELLYQAVPPLAEYSSRLRLVPPPPPAKL